MLSKLRLLALILALIAATIPSFMYITDKNRDILWILIGVNIFAYITVALTTIQTTLDVAGRDKQKLPVPARFENNPILAKWWVAVRLSWRWHAVAALARLGLAHGLAQHLHIIYPTLNDFKGIIGPLYKHTYPVLGVVEVRSQWITVIVSFFLVLVFSCIEAAFLTALTINGKTRFNSRFIQTTYSTFKRLTLTASVILLILFAKHTYPTFVRTLHTNVWSEWQLRMAGEKTHTILFTLLDNGTMIAAEIMLPIGENIYFGCAEGNSEDGGYLYQCQKFDNLPHVFERVLLGFFGLLLYAFLTGCCLFFAHRRYRRQEK